MQQRKTPNLKTPRNNSLNGQSVRELSTGQGQLMETIRMGKKIHLYKKWDTDEIQTVKLEALVLPVNRTSISERTWNTWMSNRGCKLPPPPRRHHTNNQIWGGGGRSVFTCWSRSPRLNCGLIILSPPQPVTFIETHISFISRKMSLSKLVAYGWLWLLYFCAGYFTT